MIHALPGMGADHRMFPAAWDSIPSLQRCDWIRHNGEVSLKDVAHSMIERYEIKPGDELIGASLGGMVSCEIAKLMPIKTLVLIGSAISSHEVNSLLAKIHPWAKHAPIDWIRISAGKVPVDVAQMFAGIEPSFVRAMCDAIFEWPGLGALPRTRLLRLHGRFDLIIPPPKEADLLLRGGHLISITHAEECISYLSNELSDLV